MLAAAVASTGLLAVPGGAGAQGAGSDGFVVEAPRHVGTDGSPLRLYVQPQVAVHPDDPSVLALATGEAREGGCPLNVSRDGGLSWALAAQTLMPDDLPYCVQRNYGPVLDMAFASDGTLYVGMSGSSYDTEPVHPNGPVTALIARTDDLGASHETFVVADSDPFTYIPEAVADAPPAATPPTTPPTSAPVPGDVSTTVPELPATTVPEDAPEPEPVEQTGFEQHRLNSVAVDPNNPDKVYRGWRKGIGGLVDVPFGATPLRSMIAVSDDGGETWAEAVDVTESLQGEDEVFGSDVPVVVVDPDGTAYGFVKERPRRPAEGAATPVSRLLMFKSTDGGQTWTASVFSPGAESLDNPDVAVDPNNGNLYVVYSSRGDDTEDDEPAQPSEVYFLASTDGGDTWSEPINVTDDDPAGGADQYHPGISVADNGRIDMAWHDFRNDPFFVPGEVGDMGSSVGQRYWDVYYASSANAGGTWSANTRVTDTSIDGSLGVTFSNNDIRGPLGIASSDNAAYVTWPDTRATDADTTDAEDVYFSRIRYAAVPALGAGGGESNNLLWALLGGGVALALGGVALAVGTRLTGDRSKSGAGRAAPA
ncbi:hypothetical protein BH24ACT2_BH24ACT2_11970 [soil metagenome]